MAGARRAPGDRREIHCGRFARMRILPTLEYNVTLKEIQLTLTGILP
jgi:hypothetical protein